MGARQTKNAPLELVIYALFERLWAKEVLFGVKDSVSWVRSALWYMVYISYYTELDLQI